MVQQTGSQHGGGSDTNINYGTPKSSLNDYVRNLDSFVLIGTQGGQPKMWTSATDIRQTRDLLSKAAPQFVTELSG